MRILEVTDCYPPPLMGGRDLAVQMLSRELARRGHEVEVLTLAGSGGPRTDLDGDVRVHRAAGWGRALQPFSANRETRYHPPLPDPGLVRVLRRILREHRPQVVHAHSWMLYSLLPFLPSAETRVVVTMHDSSLICPKTTYIYRSGDKCTGPGYAKCLACASGQYGVPRAVALTNGLTLMKRWHRRVDRYVAISRDTLETTAPHLGSGSRGEIEVIPPFVEDAAFESDRRERPAFVPADGGYFMFAGTLSPHKGIDVLLEAWAGLQPRVPLVLAGIRHPGTPHTFPEGVLVTEDVPHEDVLRGFGHSLAAVAPSVWQEPFGMVAVEAMAAGRPVIASAVGGLAALVADGTSGLLVPPGDVVSLRTAMQRLLVDPVLRCRMGTEGRRRATRYSADVVVSAWERLFGEVIASNCRRRTT